MPETQDQAKMWSGGDDGGETDARSDVREVASGDRGGRLDQAQPDFYETSPSFFPRLKPGSQM